MSFKVGDKAVYASHGIGEVTGIERREFSGDKQRFYILKLLDSGSVVMVPTETATARGLRAVISRSEVNKIFTLLRQPKVKVPNQTWNRRQRVYSDKLASGVPLEVASVLRELSLLQSKKSLSFSEKRMLESARSRLVGELALASRTAEAAIEAELDAIFAR